MEEAQRLNPGPWAAHSRVVAQAARSIAIQHPELEPEAAYVLGLLHDNGQRAGVTGMRHAVDGYNYMIALGYPDAARICLTHSYPTGNAAEGSGTWDGSDNEYIIPKWEAFFEIKSEFERSIGGSAYDWLPGVVENTFEGSSNGRMDNS